MPRLLELRDEEDHVVQRTDVVWRIIHGRTSADKAASANTAVDDATREILAQCELKWLALVYSSAYLAPVISKVQELHEKAQSAENPFSRWQQNSAVDDRDSGRSSVLLPKTLFSIRPRVVVNHRLAWAPLAAKTAH